VFQTDAPGYLWLITQTSSDTSEDCGIGDLDECSSDLNDASVGYNTIEQPQPGWTVEADTPGPSAITLTLTGSLILLDGCGLKSRAVLSR
jgi:hypothetical protein